MPDVMQLRRFRVTTFRSVTDSGWIGTDQITALIGTNESGKTNLLLPLWKLKPAKEGEINLLADAPRSQYHHIRNMKRKPVFIRADFTVPEDLAAMLAKRTGLPQDKLASVEVSRDLDGKYTVAFPDADTDRHPQRDVVVKLLTDARTEIEGATPSGKGDDALKGSLLARIEQAMAIVEGGGDRLDLCNLRATQTHLHGDAIKDAPARSVVGPRFGQLVDAAQELVGRLEQPAPHEDREVIDLVVNRLPSFVYYATYGNLDSEIYLPHVIDNLQRTNLGPKEEAKARTLRVLFEFVELSPKEILELGEEEVPKEGKTELSEKQIAQEAQRKKEREVLLMSASTDLTGRFREWWRQGEYRFDFAADGRHFRIWVSDDQRPEKIELEERSSGLQWFLSFYLVFLVESKAAHHGCVLLLDEAGHSLHPLAQMDLSEFFESLAAENQLIYTTHSPFLVDSDHLDRVRAVYVDDTGHTVATPDLRRSPVAAEARSLYAAHAALGLRMTDMDFAGTQPVIVEGRSDQVYCSVMRVLLTRDGALQPRREFRFVPSQGVKGIRAVASILTGRDERLPLVLCDGDAAGRELAKNLRADLYAESPKLVFVLSELFDTEGLQIEDLFPQGFLAPLIERLLGGPDEDLFKARPLAGDSIVDQAKEYAERHGMELDKGWKVALAERARARIERENVAADEWNGSMTRWRTIFSNLNGDVGAKQMAEVKPEIVEPVKGT